MIYEIEKVYKFAGPHELIDCIIWFKCKGMIVQHFYAMGEVVTVDAKILRVYKDPMEDYLKRFLKEMQRSINEAEILGILHYMNFRLN